MTSCDLDLILRFRRQARVLTGLLPHVGLPPSALALVLEFLNACAELGDGLLGQEFLERPFFDVLRLILPELGDEGNGPLQNGAFVFLAPGDDLGKFVYPFVDGFTPTPFHCRGQYRCSRIAWVICVVLTFFMVIPTHLVPFVGSYGWLDATTTGRLPSSLYLRSGGLPKGVEIVLLVSGMVLIAFVLA